jgi:DNA-binding transcriptional LysR family regulator
MRFDAELSDRIVDLVDEGFDAAVRIGAVGGQNLVARKVGATQLVCCAAPAYLAQRGEPRVPEDLAGHACLTYAYTPQSGLWPFRDAEGRERNVRISGPVHANSGSFLEALAVAGLGIIFEPDFIVGPDVRTGRLVPILRAFAPPAAGIHVVYPSRRHLSAKVRAFTDFLAQRFAVAEWILEGPPVSAGATRRKPSARR